jgi:hypothetical protein
MGLAQVVASTPTARPNTGLPCSVGALIDSLEGDELDALLLILYGDGRQRGGRGRPAKEVHRLILDGGYHASYQQINRHRDPREGSCRCDRGLPA